MTTIASVESLLSGPTTGDEGRNLIRGLIATAPTPIPLSVIDTPGTHEGAIVWALGEAEAQRSLVRLEYAKSAFRSTASRDWLGVVAEEQYGVTPRNEDFATTNVTITNASGALYGPFPLGTLRFVNDTTKAVYQNAEEVTIPIGPAATVTVGVIAIEAGTASDAQVGEINRLETPLEGVTVTNPQPALGQEAESAESLNARIDAKIGTLGVPGANGFATGGSASAFEAIARNGADNGGGVPRADGSRISVTKTRLIRDDAGGIPTVVFADDDGPLAVGDATLVSDEIIRYAEWIGTEVIAGNATPIPTTVSGTITITDCAATDTQVLAQIDAELTRANRIAPIGGFGSGFIQPKYIENAVESAGDAGKPTAFTLIDISLTPGSPVLLQQAEIIILSRGTITIVRE